LEALNVLISGNELSQRSFTELVEQNSLYKVELQFLKKMKLQKRKPIFNGSSS